MSEMCARCVLTADVPGVCFDAEGVCTVCRAYEESRDTYARYFGTEDDLRDLLQRSRRPDSDHDVLLMYSGGKDSTYVLYRLLEMDWRVLAVTFDNGYIPQGCFENIEGVCRDCGVESVIVNVAKVKMDEVFAESLRTDSTVCSGCFRGLTARGTELAIERNVPVVMTGLSRGQIVDTKIQQFTEQGITDPDEIEAMLGQCRELYHSAADKIGKLIDDQALADLQAFRRTQFVDFFRYSEATKQEIVDLLQERAPFWRRPANVGGCSSNCLINDVGIQVHKETRGYHNYAIPTAWEVRFGHISREAAIEELNAQTDTRKVSVILKGLGI